MVVLKDLKRKSRNSVEDVYYIHIHKNIYVSVCVCLSHTEKIEWDKAQRTLENLTTWQPWADYTVGM